MKLLVALTLFILTIYPKGNCIPIPNSKTPLYGNQAELENRIQKRIVTELPMLVNIYPVPTKEGQLSKGINFLIGQETTRDKITYEKVVANKAYTQTSPRKEYLKEEVVGTEDFYIFANSLKIEIDFNPSWKTWPQSLEEQVRLYNKEQAEIRERTKKSGSQSVFPTKRKLPGMVWDDFMTSGERYNYAIVDNYNNSNFHGKMFIARSKCLVAGYPVEYYNGFVNRKFEGDIPIEIDIRGKLKLSNDEALIMLHSKAMRNNGMPDRILHVQQAEAIMSAVIRIVQEEMGEKVSSGPLLTGHQAYENINVIPQIGGAIKGLKLYAGGKNDVPHAQRKYTNSFSCVQGGKIWWELEVEHPKSSTVANPLIEAILFNPIGEAIDRAAIHLEVSPGSEKTKFVYWVDKREDGKWEPGSYRLDIYCSDERIAGTSFTMLDEAK